METAKYMKNKNIVNLLHKDLSYIIQGIAFEVRKDFGLGHKEQIYQKAFEEELKRRKVTYEREKSIKIYSPKDGKFIGLYRPDFIIDNKIILEIKTLKFIPKAEIRKLYDYLRNSEYELGYLINFASPKLYIKRIIFTNNKKNFKNLLVSFSLFLVFISGLLNISFVEAAELNFYSKRQEIGLDQQFKVDLFLNTEGENINALEGKILFPADFLELKEINDGGSIVSFWLEKPMALNNTNTRNNTNENITRNNANINNTRNDANENITLNGANIQEVVFSGIVPGGFSGEKGLILSLVFKTKKEGQAFIEISDSKVLLNDGLGTETKLKTENLSININPNISVPEYIAPSDKEPPEDFKPEIVSDPNIFDGKYSLIFETKDKGSGVDKYFVYENTRKRTRIDANEWVVAESPYLLKDQKLRSYIYVKAVDKAGNERIVYLNPKYPLKWYEKWEIWSIIILVIVIGYVVIRNKRQGARGKRQETRDKRQGTRDKRQGAGNEE